MDYLTDQITVNMCSVLMRTDLVRANGGIPREYPHAADFAAWAPLLLLDKAGFVDEACATFALHNGSDGARLGLEQHIRDCTKMVELVSSHADERVVDYQTRDLIKSEARRSFARRAFIALSDYRKNGGAMRTLPKFIWRVRHDLQSAGIGSVMRFLATVLCPERLADWLRRLRPVVA